MMYRNLFAKVEKKIWIKFWKVEKIIKIKQKKVEQYFRKNSFELKVLKGEKDYFKESFCFVFKVLGKCHMHETYSGYSY